jgi:lactate dehydrogenase-like 2-hydroxyacid dehydrogenase
MKKIFVTREIPEIGIKILKDKGYEVDISDEKYPLTQKQLIKYLKKKPYDAVLTLLTDIIDAKVLDAVPTAKIFSNYAMGFNNFNVSDVKSRGVVVTNTPGDFGYCIAEHAMALILGLTTRIVEADQYVRKGKYKGWSPMNFIGTDLKGSTLGVIGTGNIGKKLAEQAKNGFEMNVKYYDVKRNESIENSGVAEFVPSIEELLKQSDIVSLQVPLLDSTYHLINEERLKMMKKTAILINTSRGPVVDEVALVKALKNKTIAGAGLDVFEFEPKLAKGLTKLPNVILTPHIASARMSARNEMATIAAENIVSYFETGVAKYPVVLG